MIKQGMSKLIVLAALVCLVGVGLRAQDVTSGTDTNNPNVSTISTSLGTPAAAPSKPAAKPSFLSSGPGMDLFIGYSYLNNDLPNISDEWGRSGISGWALSATVWLNNNVGLTADFSGHNGSPTQSSSSYDFCDYEAPCTIRLAQDSYYFLFGPTVRHQIGKVNVFAHGLVGFNRADYIASESDAGSPYFLDEALKPNSGFSAAIGGGADYMFSKHVGWRIIQADYLWSTMGVCTETSQPQTECVESVNNFRVSTGILFNLFGDK